MNICEHCERTFSSVSSLNYHKKHTKYCLQIREEKGHTEFRCEHCDNTFSSYAIYTKHLNGRCKKKRETDVQSKDLLIADMKREIKSKDNIIGEQGKLIDILTEENDRLKTQLSEEQSKHVEELKTQLEKANNRMYELAKQPKTITTTNNTTTLNLRPLDLDQLKELKITLDIVKRGADGFVDLLHEPLSHSMVCTDVARAIFKVMNENGSVVKDPRLRTHTPLIFGTLYPSIKTILDQQREVLLQASGDELLLQMDTSNKLTDVDTGITKTVKNVSNKFQDAFVNGIKEKLPKQ